MRTRAFTLVELLVVIAIISVLMALTSPFIAKSIDKARFAESQSNLQRIGAMLHSYANDHDGCFPTARGVLAFVPNCNGDETWCSWQMQLIPYIGNFKGYSGDAKTDSAFKVFRSKYAAGHFRNANPWGYFFGSHAAGYERQQAGEFGFGPLIRHKIAYPSKHILAGESMNNNFTVNDSDKDDYLSNNPAFSGSVKDLKVNILFVDGHIATYPSDLNEMKEKDPDFDPLKEFSVTYEGPENPNPAYFE